MPTKLATPKKLNAKAQSHDSTQKNLTQRYKEAKAQSKIQHRRTARPRQNQKQGHPERNEACPITTKELSQSRNTRKDAPQRNEHPKHGIPLIPGGLHACAFNHQNHGAFRRARAMGNAFGNHEALTRQ
jgi:hypothetical protein